MRSQFIIQSLVVSLSVLVLNTGCSSRTSPTDDRPTGSSQNSIPIPEITEQHESGNLDEDKERRQAPIVVQDKQFRLTNSSQNLTQVKTSAANEQHENASSAQKFTAADTATIVSEAEPSVASRAASKPNHGYIESSPLLPQMPVPDVIHPIAKNTEKYQDLNNNPVIRVADQSTSTFSIDVDTGAYSNIRRFLSTGQLPPIDAVRVEEMLNYFNYDYAAPDTSNKPFSIHTELASTPWNDRTRLLHIGLKGYTVNADDRPTANLVFLLDVSGSMSSQNKLGLLKSSLNMLSRDLTEKDRVSIVVYAGASGVVLEPTAGNDRQAISKALKQLEAGGSTNGAAGIDLAYDMAEQSMTKNSINRIILATDGDFNVGISNIDRLKKLIKHKRESGIALTTLGFGAGNYNDHLMEQLADVGNGNYAYIDTLNEARKVLSEELTSTLLTIAKDVKIQIEFNPAQVSEYRLLGYVNRKLANEDFANDKVDAGEIGAGHTVTALYEIALIGEGGEWHSKSRYQKAATPSKLNSEIAEIRLRYKMPDESHSKLTTRQVLGDNVVEELADASDNFRFSAAVAGFGQLLRQSKYLNDFDYNAAATLAADAKGDDRFGYRSEFVQLIDLADNLDEQNHTKIGTFNRQGPGDKEG